MPGRLKDALDRCPEAAVGVADDQLGTIEPAGLETSKEVHPEGLGFRGAETQADDLAPPVGVGGHSDYGGLFAEADPPASARTTITDDDLPLVTLSGPDPASVGEGADTATFTVTVAPRALATVVEYGFGGTATSGDDYTRPAGDTLTFAPATTATSREIEVAIVDDAVSEPDETVTVTLVLQDGYLFDIHRKLILQDRVVPQGRLYLVQPCRVPFPGPGRASPRHGVAASQCIGTDAGMAGKMSPP